MAVDKEMKSFLQHITEVFDKPYKWRGGNVAKGSITPKNQGMLEEYIFKTSDGGTIEVTANHFWVESDWKMAGVMIKETGHTIAIEFMKRDTQYGYPTHDMTGEGDAMRILATVLDIIKSIIKKHEPITLIFSADKGQDNRKTGTKEPTGRAGAYGAIVKRFAGKMGYKSDRDENKQASRVRWQLTKK